MRDMVAQEGQIEGEKGMQGGVRQGLMGVRLFKDENFGFIGVKLHFKVNTPSRNMLNFIGNM
jgi:hypothetical protein